MKAGAVFVNLTAAYNTVWDDGFTGKVLQLLPDGHMVCMIIKMVANCSFTLTTGNRQTEHVTRPQKTVSHRDPS